MTIDEMHPDAIATMKEMVEIERQRIEFEREEKRTSGKRDRLNDERWARGIALSAASNLGMVSKLSTVEKVAARFTRDILTGSFDEGGES